MAQQTAIKPYNTFVKGIVTEAGPLTFPENASLDEENFVLNRDGSRQRRLGMDFEQDFSLYPLTINATDSLASFRWENVANDVDRQFVVVQVGTNLLIYDATTASTSANLLGLIDASSYISPGFRISAANGMGLFIITGGALTPCYLEYNPGTGLVSINPINVLVRDFFGVFDGESVDGRPAVLSNEHKYNLQNQGWPADKITAYHSTGVYPANNQQWFLGKDANDDFDAALLNKQDFGSTLAPKGRYIISPFDRSASRLAVSGIPQPTDDDSTRPSCVAFAFQRAFYSGMKSDMPLDTYNSPNLTGMILYSQTVKGPPDLGKCYQAADPTSEHDSELVDTDGGYILIPDAGKIHTLVPKGDTLLVIAENGIWGIRGDDGGFRATVQQVTKISDFGALGPSSTVDVEDSVLYWSRGGIYLINWGDSGLSAVNITENSIQTLFNGIPNVAKSKAVGSFDPVNRQVRWMYSGDLNYDGINFPNKYDKELVLDMVLQAYYKNTISTLGDPSPYIAGYVSMPDPLLFQEGIRTRGTTVTKYLTVQYLTEDTTSASITFSYYRDAGFRDWRSLDGEGKSYTSYMLTGYEIMGDSMRNKRIDYLTCHFKMTERNAIATENGVAADNPSGCMVQAQWDWSNHPDSGKWSEAFQAYRLLRPFILPAAGQPITYGHEVVTTKNRLRGSGKALSLLFQSDEDKDCYLYGWSIKISGVASV